MNHGVLQGQWLDGMGHVLKQVYEYKQNDDAWDNSSFILSTLFQWKEMKGTIT